MRPLRFLLLLCFFVALPIALTCWSLLTAVESAPDAFNPEYNTGRFRTSWSFSTPSSLFPPSALISLTNDNSTFFLARPAAFGPSLPAKGFSGQLWVGKGFGDDALLKEDDIHVMGWELGCSDVPGWGEEESKRMQNLPPVEQVNPSKESKDSDLKGRSADMGMDDQNAEQEPHDDGTDDHLHHPLPDSNPATPAKPGEPANIDQSSKSPTHADIESLQESADIAGKIAMLARGGCGFLEKVKWAQRRGAIALIVGDNEKGAQLTIMYAKGDTSNVTIPALFTSYTSAHLLSSLVPQENRDDDDESNKSKSSTGVDDGTGQKQGKPVFTSTKTPSRQPTIVPAGNGADEDERSWLEGMLSAIGLNDKSPFSHAEDSRRPPSSGNIDWVLLEDWDDDDTPAMAAKGHGHAGKGATLSTSTIKAKATSSRKTGGDDFVIGVQDWRDADLVAPKPTASSASSQDKSKNGKDSSPEAANPVKGSSAPEATLKGGSITPGSGEYHHVATNKKGGGSKSASTGADKSKSDSKGSWLDLFRSDSGKAEPQIPPKGGSDKPGKKEKQPIAFAKDKENEGLWVTLTPTSVSTSPFFDTLLVLVVSPLVTLTVVYALLLLRSRIRRRRWRAPKSVIERLPVRTYHTMATTSSTTSSQVATTDASSPTSPLLINTTQDVSRRPRPRSQTTPGTIPGSSIDSSYSRTPPTEKGTPRTTKRKRYTGRQVECVVCLEEYVDGESQVMSLPCGHEFHADCITPWLVTRRRTCPICKGDVVRSLARGNSRWDDETSSNEQTSDDVQSRIAETRNEEPSAAIPIPVRDDDEVDVERGGADAEEPLLGDGQPQPERQSLWRNVLGASVHRLSGDTVWRQTPADRNR